MAGTRYDLKTAFNQAEFSKYALVFPVIRRLAEVEMMFIL